MGIRAVAKEFDPTAQIQTEGPRTKSGRVDAVSPTSNIRSSNLPVKKTFTQREKDEFERDAYEYMGKCFENSLAELETRNSNIETEFRRVDANQFTATAFVSGTDASSCVIRFQRRGGFVEGITYAYGKSTSVSGMNESLSVEDDGYALYLKPLGMNLRSDHTERNKREAVQAAMLIPSGTIWPQR